MVRRVSLTGSRNGRSMERIDLRVRERRRKVCDLMMQCLPQEEMAIRLGVSDATVCNDIKAIHQRWLANDIHTTRKMIRCRVKQLEQSARAAYDAFQVSKQNSETVTTSYDPVPCKACKGSGGNGKPCKVCAGKGNVLVENVTRRVQGQAGDSSLLHVYTLSITQAAKLEGLYQAAKEQKKKPREVIHTHVHSGVDWSRVPKEKILQLKYACDEALEHAQVIDVKSEAQT